jgi:hypothetical protein
MLKLSAKILIHIALILLTLCFIEYYLVKVNPYKYYKYSYDEMFNSTVRNNIIIGASHAVHGINPKYITFDNFYNFALDGANPSFTLMWYKSLLLKHKKPNLIIYEVNWFMFDSSWLWRRIEQDSRYLPISIVFELLLNTNINKIKLLKNYLFVLDGGDLYNKIINPIGIVDYNTSYNGFIALNYNKLAYNKLYCNYDSSQLNDFVALIQLIKKNKSKLILVQAPEYIPDSDSSDRLNQNRLLEDIANTYQIPFINYNGDRVSEINYNKNLYADWGHLNKEGSVQFSKLLDNNLSTFLFK